MATPEVGDRLDKRPARQAERDLWTEDDRLRAFLAIMHAIGDDAEFQYAEALKSLQRHPAETMIAIVGAYSRTPERSYPRRHALVQAAAALAHEAALPFLATVVSSPIPAEQTPEAHAFSTVAEETIIRMSAVDGIAAFAHRGDRQAIDTLMSFLTIPSFSIRRAAVTGILAAPGGPRLRRRMGSLIPKEQHFIFDLKRTPVSDAVQIKDPRLHLAPNARDFEAPKPDVLRYAGHSDDKPSTR